jgi:hypothetical protein
MLVAFESKGGIRLTSQQFLVRVIVRVVVRLIVRVRVRVRVTAWVRVKG